jgi:beta-lactamase regulating signal transducer with metallopeptidase domain
MSEMSAELPFVDAVTAVLLETTVKGTLILALAGLVTTWGMRRAAAATRHLVWSGAVACVLMLPLLRTVAPRWAFSNLPVPGMSPREARDAGDVRNARVPVAAPVSLSIGLSPSSRDASAPEEVAPRVTDTSKATVRPVTDVAVTPVTTAEPQLNAPAAASSSISRSFADAIAIARRGIDFSPMTLLLVVWAAGAALVLSRLLVGTVALARLSRQSAPCNDARFTVLLQSLCAELGIRRRVTLLVGGADAVPMTWGVSSPKVLLPPDAGCWGDGRRRAVLLHELAHIERFDTLTHTMSQVAVAVLWFHPLAIIASRRLRAERERACDDLVLAVGGVRATAYADDLLQFVGAMHGSRALGAGLAMARRSEFEGRLLSILDPSAPRARTSRRRTLAATLLVAVAALPLAGLRSAAEAAAISDGAPRVASSTRTAPERESAYGDASALPVTHAVDAAVADAALDSAAAASEMPALPMLPGIVLSTSIAEYDGGLTRSARVTLAREIAELERGRQQLALGARAATAASDSLAGPSRAVAPQDELPAAVIADFARAVAGMTSDSDKSAVLLKLAPRVGDSGEIRSAFFGSMRAMTSDTEQRRVLDGVLRGTVSDSTLAAVLDIARRMTSDTQRAAVLMTMVERRRLSSPFVRERFFQAVDGMTSESMRENVLLALVRAEPRNDALYLPVINAAAKITSERQQANVLLAIATSTPALRSAEPRARFLDTLGKLTSSSEYRRVMDALVR